MRVRFVSVLKTLAAVSLATFSLATCTVAQVQPRAQSSLQLQTPLSPHRQGFAQGDQDGRRICREDGVELGRSQALIEAYLDGFREGISAADRSRDVEERAQGSEDDGAAEGRRSGLPAGLAAGHERGEAKASAAFERLEGPPSFRSEAPPVERAALPPPRFDACEAPKRIELRLPRGKSAEVDPSNAEDASHRNDLRVPDSPYPALSTLRQEARRQGWASGDDVDDWVHGYREGFDGSYEHVFLEERRNVAWSTLRQWQADGSDAGFEEGERRRHCEAFGHGFSRGLDGGFDEGFERGFREGWDASADRHAAGPVMVIQSARLVDGSSDGVFEPGEEIFGELLLANAGLVDTEDEVLSWAGVQSVEASGRVLRPMPAQSRRSERLALGPIGQGAPLGATAIVELNAFRGARESISAIVGRPAQIDSVIAFLEARDGMLVRVVRAVVRSTATAPVDRRLRLVSESASEFVGSLAPGASRDAAVVLPARGSDLDAELSGEVRLEAEDGFWMLRRYAATTPMERATDLAASLSEGSPDEAEAQRAVLARLFREMDQAVLEPRLYKKAGDDSELTRFGRTYLGLGRERGAGLQASVADPLLRRADAKGMPRRVRAAIHDALGMKR